MSHSPRWDVIVAGDLFRDVIMSGFPEYPRLGTESFARQLRYEIGGGTAITSSGLAKLGLSTAVAGIVGQEDREWFASRLGECGVDTSLLEIHPTEPSGTTVAVSLPHDRAFFTYRGANESLPKLLDAPDVLATAKHVHFAYPFAPGPFATAINFLQRAGVTISVDVGWSVAWLQDADNLNILRQVDLFFLNEDEARLLTGHSDPQDMLGELRRRGVGNTVLKLGAQGAWLRLDEEDYRAAPPPVTVADTTGAGDCFNAGFLYGWIRGLPPQECLQMANLCGAFSTRELGGLAGFPSLSEIAAYCGTINP